MASHNDQNCLGNVLDYLRYYPRMSYEMLFEVFSRIRANDLSRMRLCC